MASFAAGHRPLVEANADEPSLVRKKDATMSMNWTEKQKKDIELARLGINSLQDLEKEYGLPVAVAMWDALDEDDNDGE